MDHSTFPKKSIYEQIAILTLPHPHRRKKISHTFSQGSAMKSSKRKGEIVFLFLLLFILTLLIAQFIMAIRQSQSTQGSPVSTVEVDTADAR
jgi:hypothetical protein